MLITQVGNRISYWSGEQTEREVRGQPSALITSQSSPQTPQKSRKSKLNSPKRRKILYLFIIFLNRKCELLPHSSSQSNTGIWTKWTCYFHSHIFRLLALSYSNSSENTDSWALGKSTGVLLMALTRSGFQPPGNKTDTCTKHFLPYQGDRSIHWDSEFP